MTCNAIATARATVNIDDQVKKLITIDIAAKIIPIFLSQKGCTNIRVINRSGECTVYSSIGSSNIQITYSPQTKLIILVYPDNQKIVNDMKQLSDYLKKAAGTILQEKVKTILKSRGVSIVNETRVDNGALILNVEI